MPRGAIQASSARSRSGSTLQADGSSNARVGTSHSLGLSASWELDLWGRVSAGVSAAQASVQASADDLAAARLSLQAKALRLEALTRNTSFNPPADLVKQVPDIVAQERMLFESSRSEMAAQLSIAQNQLTQRQNELREVQARREQAEQVKHARGEALAILLATPFGGDRHARRVAAWDRIARDMPKDKLEAMISMFGLADLPQLGRDILAGQIKGRAVIDVNA